MTFDEAFEHLKLGHFIFRAKWKGKTVHGKDLTNDRPILVLSVNGSRFINWLPSPLEKAANDWKFSCAPL